MEDTEILDTIKSFNKEIKSKAVQITANQFRDMYSELGINIDKLGCIMLDVDGSSIVNNIAAEDLYISANEDRFWINGFVAGSTPHVTLLYGLLESGNSTYKKYVDAVLKGWSVNQVQIDHVDYFESPFKDDPYYCIVAHLVISDELKQANERLQLLPHINTFPGYKAHVTIAYIRKDKTIRDKVIDDYNELLKGKDLSVKKLNYGK